MKRYASVTWAGTPREGEGRFRVGSGALDAPFTYNSRFVGNSQTNPEELLLSALAGCLTMAFAAALKEQGIGVGLLDTAAELDLVPHPSGGYRIPDIQLEIVVAGVETQEELDRALARATEMCPICNALSGTVIHASPRQATVPGG